MSNEDILGKSNTKVYFVSVRDFPGGYDHFNFTVIFAIELTEILNNIIHIKKFHLNIIKNLMNGYDNSK